MNIEAEKFTEGYTFFYKVNISKNETPRYLKLNYI